jgi:hypothetical protein
MKNLKKESGDVVTTSNVSSSKPKVLNYDEDEETTCIDELGYLTF